MNERSILLVEDNPDDAELALRALEARVNLPIQLARDGQEALDVLFGRPSPGPVPALVLLDLMLPKADGFEILRRIRASPETSEIVVVVLSSSDTPEDIDRAYALGANSYVQKPVEFSEYRETLQLIGHYWTGVNRLR